MQNCVSPRYIYVHMNMFACLNALTYIHTCIYTYAFICIYVYLYIYIYAYMNTYTYMYINIPLLSNLSNNCSYTSTLTSIYTYIKIYAYLPLLSNSSNSCSFLSLLRSDGNPADKASSS
jgi:hypothetical protein